MPPPSLREGEHAGIAEDDPRNAGPLSALVPEDLTPAELQERMEAMAAKILHPVTRAWAFERAAKAGKGGFAPPPPRLRKPGEFDWNLLKNGAHWDWVSFIREADDTLPQTCLCLLWGRPALIHPRTGVIFAIALGSIGVVARLPDDPPRAARGFDVARLGSGWRLVIEGTDWAGRAFESSAIEAPEAHP